MNIITTTAPIAVENLKKYFEDKETQFVIDYTKSTLQGEKLLTYLSNLELPCDVVGFDQEFVGDYLRSPMIVSIPSMEKSVINLLQQLKLGAEDLQFEEELRMWEKRIDSLSLFNMYTVNVPELQEWVKQFPEDDTKSLEGINFISLIKNEDFHSLFQKINHDNLTYFSSYFNDYMFKGNNLFSYWANENNPMFLLTWGITSGKVQELLEAQA